MRRAISRGSASSSMFAYDGHESFAGTGGGTVDLSQLPRLWETCYSSRLLLRRSLI